MNKNHIFIIGPSGVGKTTVGELVAKKLNYKFVDLDVEISNRLKKSISEYFLKNGESQFRIIEREVLLELAAIEDQSVIVTGAGSVLNALNIDTMKSSGTIVFLNAQIKDIVSRVRNDGNNNHRPLLNGDLESNVTKQFKERLGVYEIAQDISIGTSNRDIEAVSNAIIRQFERFSGEKSDIGSKIVVGEYLASDIAEIVSRYSSTFIITQENIPLRVSLYNTLKENDIIFHEIIVPDGEEAKSFNTYESVLNKMAELKANRSSCILALGGGVVGDLAGFVGSTFMRGIDVVQMPTTLLAQVDSSIGGKCGINISAGKNMVGTITQPKVTFSDIAYTQTLQENDYISGLGEVAKYALLGNLTVKELIEENHQQILARDVSILIPLIKSCMNHKVHIVSRDPFERNGMRATLNLGHTLAHVLEKITDFKFDHGQAVAVGIRFICELSLDLDLISKEQRNEYISILDILGLGLTVPAQAKEIGALKMVDYMYSDKKSDGLLNLVLFLPGGGVELTQDVDKNIVIEALDRFIV